MPVLADIFEVILAMVMLLVPILWGIKQIADARQAPAPPEDQPDRPRPVAPQPVRQAGGQQADPLRNQVEEFLRRAGRAPQGERAQAPPRDIEVLLDEDAAVPRAPAEPARPVLPRPASAAATVSAGRADAPLQRPGRSVAPRKRKTLAERATERAAERASRLAEQMSHLGQRIIEDDQQFDVQLKAKFDHKVGTFAKRIAEPVEVLPVDTPASQIAAMLASPDGVRQAIILNEILTRPSERW